MAASDQVLGGCVRFLRRGDGWFSDVHFSNRSLISSMAAAEIEEWRGSMTIA
jgi:hypothetical protein